MGRKNVVLTGESLRDYVQLFRHLDIFITTHNHHQVFVFSNGTAKKLAAPFQGTLEEIQLVLFHVTGGRRWAGTYWFTSVRACIHVQMKASCHLKVSFLRCYLPWKQVFPCPGACWLNQAIWLFSHRICLSSFRRHYDCKCV